MSEKVDVQNVNHPGLVSRVDKAKYDDMRQALLKVLPVEKPGMKVADAQAALKPFLDDALFPGGAKSGWWLKTVQLDLEAKGLVGRADIKPLHIHRI